MTLLDRIVTPAFVAWQAHMWFAYAVVFTFAPGHHWAIWAAVLAAGIKEFYIDKHFETAESFDDNAEDFAGYLCGIVLAALCRHVGL